MEEQNSWEVEFDEKFPKGLYSVDWTIDGRFNCCYLESQIIKDFIKQATSKSYQAGRENALNELKLHLEKQLGWYDTVNKDSLFRYIDEAIKNNPHAK